MPGPLRSSSLSGQGGPLGQFDGHGDVGSPKISGSATYNAVSQEYTLTAGGVNMWAARDEFHFVWKRMTGGFILQARVELVGQGVDPHYPVRDLGRQPGQWIAFISFPKQIDPSDHPYYKRVYLRLMPVSGGAPRVIAYVYGGQGTINVPSWSPDGGMLAFVSNTDVH